MSLVLNFKFIAEHHSESLSSVNPRSSKDLYSSVKPAIKNYHERLSLGTKYGHMFDEVNAINTYFADISSDPHYDSQVIEQLFGSFPQQYNWCLILFIDYKVSNCCLKLKRFLLDLISCHIGYFGYVLHTYSLLLTCYTSFQHHSFY
jgi:hypothetical protein